MTKEKKDRRIYVQIPKAVADAMADGSLNHRDTRVIIALYMHSNPKNEDPVFPSRETIKKITGVSLPQISASLRRLEKMGALVTYHEKGKSNRYYLRKQWNGVPLKPLPKSGTSQPLPELSTTPLPDSRTLTNNRTKSGREKKTLWGRSPMASGEAAWMAGAGGDVPF